MSKIYLKKIKGGTNCDKCYFNPKKNNFVNDKFRCYKMPCKLEGCYYDIATPEEIKEYENKKRGIK